jgi:transposase InsO family protein
MFPDGPLPATKQEPHTRRFEAKFVDYLWHTDLHELKAETDKTIGTRDILYMIAFIDDRTRFIMHWATMTNKRAETTAEILRTALTWGQRPCVLGTDNGGEFIGAAFQQVLLEYNVKFWHTAPRTPEQNGKIERFWRTLDKSRNGSVDPRKIARIIDLYNHRWRHRALKMTPAQSREVSTHWAAVMPSGISPDIMENLTWMK